MTTAFSTDPAATPPAPTNSEGSPPGEQAPTPSAVGELVGEGKKFTSVEALAIGKMEADNFVDQLKREAKELREELDKRLTSEEALAKIQEQSKISAENTTQTSADEIADLVKRTVHDMSAADIAKANVLKADAILAEKYGDKRGEVVAAKAKELGVDVSFLEDAAAKSPSAFLGMIGLSSPASAPNTTASTAGSVNTDALAQINTGTKTDSYKHFEELRKTNPKEYFKPETQNKMLRLAAVDPDFYKS